MATNATTRLALAAAAAAVLAACAAGKPPPAEVNLSGYSSAFKQGYSDGCGSARGWTPRKDAARYREDIDYMMGWNDGYSICGGKTR